MRVATTLSPDGELSLRREDGIFVERLGSLSMLPADRSSPVAASAAEEEGGEKRARIRGSERPGLHHRGTDGAARTGEIVLARGVVRTPAFMPVGTAGTVKAMYMEQVKALGADIILGNTYHLMLRPGAERVAALGGLHTFSGWAGPILTDSGGFQVMSLAKLRKLDETASPSSRTSTGRRSR